MNFQTKGRVLSGLPRHVLFNRSEFSISTHAQRLAQDRGRQHSDTLNFPKMVFLYHGKAGSGSTLPTMRTSGSGWRRWLFMGAASL